MHAVFFIHGFVCSCEYVPLIFSVCIQFLVSRSFSFMSTTKLNMPQHHYYFVCIVYLLLDIFCVVLIVDCSGIVIVWLVDATLTEVLTNFKFKCCK